MFTAVETEQGPVGIPGTEAFLSGISWSKDSSLQEPPWVPKDGFQQLLREEHRTTWGKMKGAGETHQEEETRPPQMQPLPISWSCQRAHFGPTVKNTLIRASLVAQWIIDFWSRKIPHAAEQLSSCALTSACALESVSCNHWAFVPPLLKPACLEAVLHNKRSRCNERPTYSN